ncbi:hypothetical protein M9Y10_036479 [Tritrichomonas musculus]|uniref:DUF3447 domain-containing protein n=1 Tax=Tritrichomonas musculus TaxID=1915356 RepID=A0ABR2GVT4_9EUKA
MDAKQYLDERKTLYNHLLDFIDNSYDDQNNFTTLISDIQNQNITQNKNELHLFLSLLTTIANNHHRYSNFFNKIDNILSFLNLIIKQKFSNLEIFDIFKSNNRLLLFFIKNDFFTNDKKIMEKINDIDYFSKSNDCDEKVKEKRENGENDSYICQLIRDDSVVQFISYTNQANCPLSETIKNSIYETNEFLIRKDVTLLEYAAFFGSIQIFKYLMLQGCKLTSRSLFLLAIHSNSAEMIHLLEENKILPGKGIKWLYEAIKCHHNNIVNYIINNYIQEKGLCQSFRYYNFEIITQNEVDYSFLINSCKHNYVELVKILLQKAENDITNKKIIIIFIKFKIHVHLIKFLILWNLMKI